MCRSMGRADEGSSPRLQRGGPDAPGSVPAAVRTAVAPHGERHAAGDGLDGAYEATRVDARVAKLPPPPATVAAGSLGVGRGPRRRAPVRGRPHRRPWRWLRGRLGRVRALLAPLAFRSGGLFGLPGVGWLGLPRPGRGRRLHRASARRLRFGTLAAAPEHREAPEQTVSKHFSAHGARRRTAPREDLEGSQGTPRRRPSLPMCLQPRPGSLLSSPDAMTSLSFTSELSWHATSTH